MKKIADIAAYLFILAVVILGVVSILGVWDFFSNDVIYKSFQSIGLLALVAVIILVADHFIDHRAAPASATGLPEGSQAPVIASESSAIFKGVRMFTLYILIASIVLLALAGIMAIWEVLSGEVLHKSLASIAIAAFSSLVIVVTCLERENNLILYKKKISGGMIFLVLILAWFFAVISF